MTTPFEMPDGLGEQGRWLWGLYTEQYAAHLTPVDTVLLAEACKFADLLPRLHEKAKEGAKGAMLNLGIATDKLLLLSARLGLSIADRAKLTAAATKATKAADDAKPRAKVERPRKSSIDGLTPEQLGLKGYPGQRG